MKTLNGTIIGLKTPKTALVEVTSQVVHPIYKKSVQRTNTLKVHYEDIAIKEGDQVIIGEVRPISKTKHFKIIKVV